MSKYLKFTTVPIVLYYAVLMRDLAEFYIEAMASGLPVIAHKNLNTEWILGKNNPGLLDLTIKNKILNFINGYVQNSNKKELITMNIDKANKSFDWNNLIEDYLNMYSSIYN